MIEVKDLKNMKLPNTEDFKLSKLDFQNNEAHGEFEPVKKDSEFDILVSFDLSNNSKVIDAISHLTLTNSKTKRKFKKFLLIEKKLDSSRDYLEFVKDLVDRAEMFVKKNLGPYSRTTFKMNWASKKANIIKKVLAKLDEGSKKSITKEEAEDIIMGFADREEMDDPNYAKKIKLDDAKHDLLRSVYDSPHVKKLYTYSTLKFGFEFLELRFDVTAGFAEIKKLKL